jgi:hypothetical protein
MLQEHEKAALRHLYADKRPPISFHQQLLERMKNEQLLRAPRPLLQTSLSGLAAAAFFLLAFAALGFLAGRLQRGTNDSMATTAPTVGKEKFVLLVHNDDVPPADPTEQFEAYSKWLQDIKATRFADGEALHGDRILMRKPTGTLERQQQKLTQGNPDQVSGFFIFEAENMEEATKIAETCPHLAYKGSLELRQVFQ